MKDFDIRIRSGGDDAISAVEEYVATTNSLVDQLRGQILRLLRQTRGCEWHLWGEDEREPRDGLYLIAWDGREHVTIGHLVDGKWFDPVVAIAEYGQPTHWMTMPDAPRPPVPNGPAAGRC